MTTIKTADEAIDLADRLVRKYYPFMRLEKAAPENGAWVVEFDVGILAPKLVRLRMDRQTGHVLEFVRGD